MGWKSQVRGRSKASTSLCDYDLFSIIVYTW